MNFKLISALSPKGSQPNAITKLTAGLSQHKMQTLLGVTGSGKTFTVAHVIANYNRPTLVIAHNKTLAAQLYEELRELFPENKVEYFVSYYDYYQPESYVPQRDMYIEKDAQINPKIEQMRLSATASLLSRNDVIVVASVSCIYGLGDPTSFKDCGFVIRKSMPVKRFELLQQLIALQFERNDTELLPGRFRVKGETIDLAPGYIRERVRIELFGNVIEKISLVDQFGALQQEIDSFFVFPAKHFVIRDEDKKRALQSISTELDEHLPTLGMMESHRLKQRTLFDIEMIQETGTCKGIENYSRHFDGRSEGEKPFCLLDYFPDDFLLVIDESHQTLPQVRAMYKGDRSRKSTLVEYGFRLPSCLDNRPLQFHEFETYMNHVIFVSATPGDYELERSPVVEQIIRPTGLVDPKVEVRPMQGQVEDLLDEVKSTIKKGYRALVMTLTKKLSEELASYLNQRGIKSQYMHSDIDTLDRTDVIAKLRRGEIDVIVGINLLREGLDIPEVALVAIFDADKEGFLRDARSLMQIIGRACRNVDSKVVLYADVMTGSMKRAIDEIERRRVIQLEYNQKHNITPASVVKALPPLKKEKQLLKSLPKGVLDVAEIEKEMKNAAEMLDFERAIELRNILKELKRL